MPGLESIQADLASGAGLEQLRNYRVDVCVHLGAAAGWCSLEQGLSINVLGTQRLLDILIDCGCKKFVVASSISAVNAGAPNSPPPRFPVPDDQPYIPGYPWPYAFSKHQVEELVRFMVARDADRTADPAGRLDITVLRIGCCITDPPGPPTHLETALNEELPIKPTSLANTPGDTLTDILAPMAVIAISDMTRCLMLAAMAERKAGLRTYNVTAEQSLLADGVSVPEVMRKWFGAAVASHDWSHYERPGHGRGALFDISRVREELGFEPRVNVLTAYDATE